MMLKLSKIVLPIIAFIFLGNLIVNYWPEVVAANWQINCRLLSFSLVALTFIFFLDAYGWWLILKASDENISAFKAMAIWLRSSLTRYIPGVVWAYVSRVVLLAEHGVTSRNCIFSIVVESVMLTLGSFTIGLPILLTLLDVELLLGMGLGILCIAAILFGLSGTGFRCLSQLPLIGHYICESEFSRCRWRWTIYFFYSFFWLCFSAVFLLFLTSISIRFESFNELFFAGSAFSASFCIGFVLIVFPGGLGIREATLYGLLSMLINPALAITISVASRLWLIVGELVSLVTFLVAAYFCRFQR